MATIKKAAKKPKAAAKPTAKQIADAKHDEEYKQYFEDWKEWFNAEKKARVAATAPAPQLQDCAKVAQPAPQPALISIHERIERQNGVIEMYLTDIEAKVNTILNAPKADKKEGEKRSAGDVVNAFDIQSDRLSVTIERLHAIVQQLNAIV